MHHRKPQILRGLVSALVLSAAACSENAVVPVTLVDGSAPLDAKAPGDAASALDAQPDDAATGDDAAAPQEAAAPDNGPRCIDTDGDGYFTTECMGMPVDCDDNNGQVNPGRSEVCDRMDLDEDCNPCTVAGALDGDGDTDTFLSATCANTFRGATPMCPSTVRVRGGRVEGTDCEDGDGNVRPNQTEACNQRDDNCNGMIDEGVTTSSWYLDRDGDGRAGRSEMAVVSCTAPSPRHVLLNDDCDDTDPLVSPGAPEVCDGAMRDENCNQMVNEGCGCAPVGMSRRCCSDRGTQACAMTPMGAAWSACSAPATMEVCDNIDNDCDGMIDEGTRVRCYADGDGDTYTFGGATASERCPDAARTQVGGCPAGYTNRAPTTGATDCDDRAAAINPGATEACDGIDNNCNGTTDEGRRISCYGDGDGDTYPVRDAPAVPLCPDPNRPAVGNCPTGYTNRVPTSTAFDCNDAVGSINSGARELCSTTDEDCNGDAYNGFTRPGTSRSCSCGWIFALQGTQSANSSCTYDATCNYATTDINTRAANATITIPGNGLLQHDYGAACGVSNAEWCFNGATSTTREYRISYGSVMRVPRGRYAVRVTLRNLFPGFNPWVAIRVRDINGARLGPAADYSGAPSIPFNGTGFVDVNPIDIASDCNVIDPQIFVPITAAPFPTYFAIVSIQIVKLN